MEAGAVLKSDLRGSGASYPESFPESFEEPLVRGSASEGGWVRGGGGGGKRTTRWLGALTGAVAVCFVLIFVAFALVADVETTKKYYTDESSVSSTVSFAGSIAPGTPVSMTAPGAVRVGGGTSIYSKIEAILEEAPSDLTISPLFSNAYLVSTNRYGTDQTTFSVVVLSSDSQATVKYSVTKPFNVHAIETLSQEGGVFVSVSEDESPAVQSSTIQVGIVDPTTYAITFGVPVEYNAGVDYSLTPAIARLTDSQFALCHYTNTDAVAKVGTVTLDTLDVSFSNTVAFADNRNYDVMFGLVSLSESLFMAIHYNGAEDDYVGELKATTINVASVDGATTISPGATFASSTLTASGFVYGTRITDTSAVVSFNDYNTGGGISLVAVSLEPTDPTQAGGNFSVTFGDVWEFTSGETARGYMDLDIVTISDDGQFLILFSDLGNFGAMTLATGKLFANGQIAATSPNYVISGPNNKATSMYFWGALGCGTTDPNSIRAVVGYVLSDHIGEAEIYLSTFAKLPSPVGVLESNRLLLSGVVGSYAGISVGALYYSTTEGNLVSSGLLHGQSSPLPYVVWVDSNTNKEVLLSLDSQVGIGVSDTSVAIRQATKTMF